MNRRGCRSPDVRLRRHVRLDRQPQLATTPRRSRAASSVRSPSPGSCTCSSATTHDDLLHPRAHRPRIPPADPGIRDRGHELGHHGWVHENPANFDLDGERDVFRKGLDALEQVAGVRAARATARRRSTSAPTRSTSCWSTASRTTRPARPPTTRRTTSGKAIGGRTTRRTSSATASTSSRSPSTGG